LVETFRRGFAGGRARANPPVPQPTPVPQPAPSSPARKLAPALWGAFHDVGAATRAVAAGTLRPLGGVMRRAEPGIAHAVVFVESDADIAAECARLGVVLNPGRSAVRTALVPVEQLAAFGALDHVMHVAESHVVRPLMDVALERVGVPQFARTHGLDGRGVIVGIVDTGIDSTHPAFTGRIMRVWDQDLPGNGTANGFPYGRELSGESLVASIDLRGHGTHIAGIAAGADATYGGVAPAATIVAVKTTYNNANIKDAVEYIFAIADELGVPAVVNLSLGGHADPHDGTDELSRAVDELSGPGRIVCCAAGNEGNDDIHALATVPQGGAVDLELRVPPGHQPFVQVLAWYGNGDEIAAQVIAPSGIATPIQPVLPAEHADIDHAIGADAVFLSTREALPGADHHLFALLGRVDGSAPVTPGVWRVRLHGARIADGTVHAWCVDDPKVPVATFRGATVSDSHKVGAPAAAASAISVGAFTTRTGWTDADGQLWQTSAALDTVTEFSSEGPLRNGALKPDIVAPGAFIVSSLSAEMTHRAGAAARQWHVDNRHTVMAGTSMSSPFVAGLVALMLQRRPDLTPEQAKDMLKAAARIPGQPPGAFDRKWGFGLVDARALQALLA
jgi:subtilisin family serine protease